MERRKERQADTARRSQRGVACNKTPHYTPHTHATHTHTRHTMSPRLSLVRICRSKRKTCEKISNRAQTQHRAAAQTRRTRWTLVSHTHHRAVCALPCSVCTPLCSVWCPECMAEGDCWTKSRGKHWWEARWWMNGEARDGLMGREMVD